MSNRADLVATQFVTKNGESSYGYRLYDDYATIYSNYDAASIMDISDFDLLAKVKDEVSYEGKGILDYIREEKVGITINGNYYDWDEIKHIF
jgi:hypothetical protein